MSRTKLSHNARGLTADVPKRPCSPTGSLELGGGGRKSVDKGCQTHSKAALRCRGGKSEFKERTILHQPLSFRHL